MAKYPLTNKLRKLFGQKIKRGPYNKTLSSVDQVVLDANPVLKEDKRTKVTVKQEAQGVAIHTSVNSATSSNYLAEVNDYSDPNLNEREQVVPLCRRLRKSEGICGSVADLWCDFAITKGAFVSDNKDLQKMLNQWAANVNSPLNNTKNKGTVYPVPGVRAVARKICDAYITDGDSVFSLFWSKGAKYTPDAKGATLPTSIKVLDSLGLKINPELAKLGVEEIEYTLDRTLIRRIKTPQTEADKLLSKSIPKEWKKFIDSGKPILLDPAVTYHIKRNAKDWSPWGESIFIKAFTAVAAKRRIQALDAATISGMLNRITIFKLGLADKTKNKEYYFPSPARVQMLVDLVTSPKAMNAFVWPGPDLTVEDVGPDGKVLEMTDKYKQADIDILRALHTSPLLIDGGSSGQSVRDWAAFIATEVGLDYIRDEIARIFSLIAKEIAIANGMKFEHLFYKFDTQMLKDEKRVRNFALEVFRLGGISAKTFVDTMGYDFETEQRLREQEKADGTSELFVNPNAPGMTNIPDQSKNGRPEGTTNDDRGEESDEKTRDINNPGAQAALNPLDSPTMYLSLYSKFFEGIKKNVGSHIDREDTESASFSLLMGFSQFHSILETQLRETYLQVTGGKTTEDLGKLLEWSGQYTTNFYMQLSDKLESSPESFISYLSKNDHRISMYATESYRKAFWVGKISKARLQGKTLGKWNCENDNTCDQRLPKGARIFELDYLIDNFPGHPYCECTLEFE